MADTAMANMTQQQDAVVDAEEMGGVFVRIEELEQKGVNVADVKKLKEAGFGTAQSVVAVMKKELLNVKGLSEMKVDKIVEAARALSGTNSFMTCSSFQEKMKQRFKLSTGSSALDKILGGGIETATITELYGEYRCGKTQLCHALAVVAQLDPGSGGACGRTLYIDSEGTFRPDRITQICKSRSLPEETVMDNILYARCYNSEHLQKLLVEASAHMADEDEPFALIVVDSIMGMFRTDFTGRGELAERQQLLGRVLSKLQKLAEEFNVAVLLTNQVMSDPSGGLAFASAAPKPVGGHVLAHMSTSRVFIKKGKGDQRIAKLVDSPYMPEGECCFEICDQGIRNAID